MVERMKKPRITEEDIQRLESLDQYDRRDELCSMLKPVIKDEEDAVPTYEDLKKALSTYILSYDANDIIDPIIFDETKHKRVLTDLSRRIGCRNK